MPALRTWKSRRGRPCVDAKDNGRSYRYTYVYNIYTTTRISHTQCVLVKKKKIGLVHERWDAEAGRRGRRTTNGFDVYRASARGADSADPA